MLRTLQGPKATNRRQGPPSPEIPKSTGGDSDGNMVIIQWGGSYNSICARQHTNTVEETNYGSGSGLVPWTCDFHAGRQTKFEKHTKQGAWHGRKQRDVKDIHGVV